MKRLFTKIFDGERKYETFFEDGYAVCTEVFSKVQVKAKVSVVSVNGEKALMVKMPPHIDEIPPHIDEIKDAIYEALEGVKEKLDELGLEKTKKNYLTLIDN